MNFLSSFSAQILNILMMVLILIPTITLHECAHGYAASALGDPTAKNSGRLTLNPMAHLDLWGALCLVFFHFGWAKPVPVNPMYFSPKTRKRDMALVAFAGPLTNTVLAFLVGILYAVIARFLPENQVVFVILGLLKQLAETNLYFAIFNLVPVPPLDGSRILGALLPDRAYEVMWQLERYSAIILIVLVVSGVISPLLNTVFTPLYNVWARMVLALMGVS